MILTPIAVEHIKQSSRLRLLLGLELEFGEQWIIESAHRNKKNGPFTTWAALHIIMEETGLKMEDIIQKAPEPIKLTANA